LAIIIVGASHFDSSFINLQFHSDNYNYDYSLISSAAGITLWSFIGLETATIPYEHIENPRRNIPLATILGIVIASAIYIASTIVIMGIIPTNELANATISPFITVSQMLFGDYGKWILIIGAVISCFGCINGLIFAQGQLTKAAADDDLFPGIFAQRNKHNMPTLGLVVTAFIQTVIILSTLFYKNYVAEFDVIVLMASLATLIPYLYAASGSFIICKQSENQSKKGTYMLIAFLAALYSFWVITISDNEVILHGSFLVFIGVILYSLLYEGKINND
jgi:amino acid transporter